jgi:hypothetical protein
VIKKPLVWFGFGFVEVVNGRGILDTGIFLCGKQNGFVNAVVYQIYTADEIGFDKVEVSHDGMGRQRDNFREIKPGLELYLGLVTHHAHGHRYGTAADIHHQVGIDADSVSEEHLVYVERETGGDGLAGILKAV